MKCPVCVHEQQVSCVTPGASMSTCMGFSAGHYDEHGEWVQGRDPNWHTTNYWCSRGHHFDVVRREGEPDRVTTHTSTPTYMCTITYPKTMTDKT